jgi:hypothetical protein
MQVLFQRHLYNRTWNYTLLARRRIFGLADKARIAGISRVSPGEYLNLFYFLSPASQPALYLPRLKPPGANIPALTSLAQ